MTKYKSLDDIGFRRVSSQLRRWIEEIVNEGSKSILKVLLLWLPLHLLTAGLIVQVLLRKTETVKTSQRL